MYSFLGPYGLGIVSDSQQVFGFQAVDIASIDLAFYVVCGENATKAMGGADQLVAGVISTLNDAVTSGSMGSTLAAESASAGAIPALSSIDKEITLALIAEHTKTYDLVLTSQPTVTFVPTLSPGPTLSLTPSSAPTQAPSPLCSVCHLRAVAALLRASV